MQEPIGDSTKLCDLEGNCITNPMIVPRGPYIRSKPYLLQRSIPEAKSSLPEPHLFNFENVKRKIEEAKQRDEATRNLYNSFDFEAHNKYMTILKEQNKWREISKKIFESEF